MTPSRTYLAIPHDQHQDVKKLAGKLEDGRQAVLFDREKMLVCPGWRRLEKLKPGCRINTIPVFPPPMPERSLRIFSGQTVPFWMPEIPL